MKKFYPEKKLLIEKLFEFGEKTIRTDAKNSIADYFEILLKDTYDYEMSSRTIVRCYDNIYKGKNPNYKLKNDLGWDFLSKILDYKDFEDFCEKEHNQDIILEKDNPVLEEISITLNHIRETLSKGLSYLMTGKNSFSIIGILLITGFVVRDKESFWESKNKEMQKKMDSAFVVQSDEVKSSPIKFVKIPLRTQERKKECMYWNGEVYVDVFCDELIEGREIIASNEERKMIRKITKPDTLTIENALGKVWYDKSNGKVEFFTHYGIHPENGKTLKEASSHILEVYAKK